MSKKKSASKRPRQKPAAILRNNFYMLGRVFRLTPEYIFWMVVEGIIWGGINSATGLFTYYLFNAIGDGTPFSGIARIIGIMAVIYLLVYAFDKWYWIIKNPTLKQKLHLKMHKELFELARRADLSSFDDPAYYNDFVWAMNESDSRAVAVVETTGKLINRVVSSGALFTLLFTIDYRVALLLIVSAILNMILEQAGNRVWYEQNKKENPLWRKDSYINRVYHQSDYAKELRISHANDLLMKEYAENCDALADAEVHYGKRYFVIYGFWSSIFGHGTYFAVMLFMFRQLTVGAVALGSFAAAMSVIWKVRWLLTDLLGKVTEYRNHSLYIEKYLEFVHQKPSLGGSALPPPDFSSLELRDVSFSYEFSGHARYAYHDEDDPAPEEAPPKEALQHVNLTIHRGEKIALVGYNGAGKTTLIKLLLRLYDPTGGEILYNGQPLSAYNAEELRKKIGVVFQDFKIYATSIAENVMNGPYNEETDKETVLNALHAADFDEKLATLPEGVATHLTREFNDKGTNLSGGEAQKVAIARVFAHPFELLIMDEPSSALDPMAEYALNQSILHYAEGKTVVFISHRLSTTRMADKIYMFAEGKLIEAGSHDELMQKNGKYAEMFNLQAEKYRRAEE